jgi:chemotaxis protein methyltransferase CheR
VTTATSGASDDQIRPPTEKEFALFQSLIRKEAGINLSSAKKALLVGRLSRRLRELGLRSFGAYHRFVTEEDPSELTRMLDCICTNETQFFREPAQFEYLRDHVVPEWRGQAAAGARAKLARVWSAACSTGQEPYSLAMLLLDQLPPDTGWELEILATDLSTRALETAREATWPVSKASEIPPAYRQRFMLKGVRSQEGQTRAAPAIRNLVSFHRMNLSDESYPALGPFDAIFCRNVLIYFDAASKARVVNRLLDLLAPTGYLFLGHAESLNGLTDRARSVGPTIYQLVPPAHSGRAAAPDRPSAAAPNPLAGKTWPPLSTRRR